jgi:sorbitol/mannitol transport system permease protein
MTTLTAAPKTASPPSRPRTSTGISRWKRRIPLLPALVFTIVVTQLPFVATLVISTFQWNILKPGDRHFVGLSNFRFVFTDDRLRTAVLNTIVLTASVVLISVVLGLGLAMLLDRRFLGRGLARTMLIAPFLVMPVAAALLWKHAIYNPDYGLLNGTLNAVYRLFGAANGPTIDWVSSYPMPAVVVSLVWQWTPFMMLILLAGLQAQPGDVLEAARMDGASALQTFRHITLKSIEQADPSNPGVQPRPTVGIQFVAIPEFQDLGTKVTQEISAAIAGKTSVDKALDDGQKLAEDVAKNYQ